MPPFERFKIPWFGGAEIPVPRFAVYALGVLIVIGAGFWMWPRLVKPVIYSGKVEITESTLIQLQETQKHFNESPEFESDVFNDGRGRFTIKVYRSDLCVLAVRVTPDPTKPVMSTWFPNSKLLPDASPPPSVVGVLAPAMPPHLPVNIGMALAEAIEQADSTYSIFAAPAYAGDACSGQCINPHPGEFEQWYEEIGDKCWIRVWRKWPDGCQHHQGYNRCGNYWDTYPDGSPKVYWVCCVE